MHTYGHVPFSFTAIWNEPPSEAGALETGQSGLILFVTNTYFEIIFSRSTLLSRMLLVHAGYPTLSNYCSIQLLLLFRTDFHVVTCALSSAAVFAVLIYSCYVWPGHGVATYPSAGVTIFSD